jgi:hypothetical protein
MYALLAVARRKERNEDELAAMDFVSRKYCGQSASGKAIAKSA